jgi:ubiquinol-cytochrome c reductase cytochrome b subunit
MIILVGIHMIRVYLTASYKFPREMSWITGAFLLLFTLGMGFTGQLLRWDSNGVWSAIVGAEQAGRIPLIGSIISGLILAGKNLGGATLSRFFAVHVFLFPAFLFLIIGIHVYLVIRNGISEPPKTGSPVDKSTYRQWYHNMLKEKGVPFWPDAGWRDMAFGVLVVTIILILAFVFKAPEIGAPPDPSNIQSNPRPDWYFLWIFALFALMPRDLEAWAIAFLPLIIGIILLALPLVFEKGERSPARRPWSVAIVVIMLTTVAIFWHYGELAPWSPNFGVKPLSAQIIGNTSQEALAGADLFYKKGCLYCHKLSDKGGIRGPDLSGVSYRLTGEQMIIRIINGSDQMPAYASVLTNHELNKLVAFLKTRKSGRGSEP